MPSASPPAPSALDALLAHARQVSATGDAAGAQLCWQKVLEQVPHHPEAWYQLGWQALSEGRYGQAQDCLRRAVAGAPQLAVLHSTLARAYRLDGQFEQALASLERAVLADPLAWGARYEQGEVLVAMGRRRAAAMAWQMALSITPPGQLHVAEVKTMVDRAQAFVGDVRSELGEHLRAQLGDLYAQADSHERRRFDACLGIVEGTRRFATQQPATLPYPRLPAIPFFDRDEFEWVPQIEAAFPAILAELHDLLERPTGFEPYVQSEPGISARQFSALDHTLDWGAFFLWKHGQRIEENCRRCPATEAALAAVPQVHIAERAPVSFFSALKPRTHIPMHFGATNTRLTVHLPLIVPENCAISVGGEVRGWTPGELLIFDDTFEHEAWNRSDSLRVVLIFDVWNPLLSPLERELVTRTIGGLLDFYRGHADLGEL
ncbi:aspartyl/asparaginyl beta-hydroxylase domain-containing protein [Agrilutibacter solisilvae]|uniref:Aspartyl/asparaginyl beta-hydroxylase domain-containing protein n=1 Tax=Agrilutibacter solisilvae TaxID=2763317 RepID=A0A974XZ38_9GAMM|nr:aspartyl/asparaginyl beta-hydroxylase domain-containing protein [Lysobacter solisilvae]QSX78441.1 aspartyl/asparaginyl beta-hydroxylase domain-containing protein [Lysobacter solisilvae]